MDEPIDSGYVKIPSELIYNCGMRLEYIDWPAVVTSTPGTRYANAISFYKVAPLGFLARKQL